MMSEAEKKYVRTWVDMSLNFRKKKIEQVLSLRTSKSHRNPSSTEIVVRYINGSPIPV